MHQVVLGGLRSTPIAGYLGALGVLRLVSEQVDSESTGYWRDGTFVLVSPLDQVGLEDFFLRTYRPTPLLAPWNGGSGFFPKDKGAFKKGLGPIEESDGPRFSDYRAAIETCRRALDTLKLAVKPTSDEAKQELLAWLRGNLADEHLLWLESSILLSADGAKYPPLLGSGGNDGRLEFSANFMQRLVELLGPAAGTPALATAGLFRQVVFGEAVAGLGSSAIGQFSPGSAGGVNAETGYDAGALTNPWGLVLALEGSVALSSVAVRRFEADTKGALSYPFTVRPASVAYGSVASDDRSSARAEVWMPLWAEPTSYPEVHALFAEGRATLSGGQRARNGIDFYRALAGLGVDRGIESFERYGLLRRSGLSFFAVPLERVWVKHRRAATVLTDLDGWLEHFRRRTSSKAPPALARLRQRLDAAVVEVCRRDDGTSPQAVNDLLVVLGEVEVALSKRQRFVDGDGFQLPPVPRLSRRKWLSVASTSSDEFQIAQAVASIGGLQIPESSKEGGGTGGTGGAVRAGGVDGVSVLREYLAPVTCSRRRPQWDFTSKRNVGSRLSSVESVLQEVLLRIILDVSKSNGGLPLAATCKVSVGSAKKFLVGALDDRRLLQLLRGLSLINWFSQSPRVVQPAGAVAPIPVEIGAFYPVLKLCFAEPDTSQQNSTREGRGMPLDPRILRWALAGDATRASALACRRLRGSGYAPAVPPLYVDKATSRRIAAALLFPISLADQQKLGETVLRWDPDTSTSDGEQL